MENISPMPGYITRFIAANQEERANNILPGDTKIEHLEIIRKNIRDFKISNGLDKVIILWTANTEKMCEIIVGVNDSYESLMKSISNNHKDISPSTIYATASILEDVLY